MLSIVFWSSLFALTNAMYPPFKVSDWSAGNCSLNFSNHEKPSHFVGICDGESTTFADNPFIVSLRYGEPYNSHCCGGSILSLDPPKILTAAHCFGCGCHSPNDCDSWIAIGCNDPNTCKDGTRYEIKSMVNDPNYDDSRFDSDVAVITLATDIESSTAGGDRVSVISLAGTVPANGASMTVVGYGLYNSQRDGLPSALQTGTVQYITNNDCSDRMPGGSPGIDDTMLCGVPFGVNSQTTTCSGDSGGPWISNGMQVGITSWGYTGCNGQFGCRCCYQYPGVAANGPFLKSWIENQ